MTELASTAATPPSSSRNIELLTDWFAYRPENCDAFFYRSPIFEGTGARQLRSAARKTPASDVQKSAHMHCLFGPGITARKQHFRRFLGDARVLVYDLQYYDEAGNGWGPFLPDGSWRVDWERMEAILLVLSSNILTTFARVHTLTSPSWWAPFAGVSPRSFEAVKVAKPAPDDEPGGRQRRDHRADTIEGEFDDELATELAARDPYGVTGTWGRIVCFLDYREFCEFNFHTPAPRPPARRPAIATREATRYIKVRLHVTKIEEPGEGDGKDYPVVHYRGVSKALFLTWDPNANSGIRGKLSRRVQLY